MNDARLPSIARWVLPVLAALSPCLAPSTADAAESLLGTWRIERIADTDAAGKVSYPYGEHPQGYIVYDATGHVHVQIVPVSTAASKGAQDEAPGYAAYFGTYRVDSEKGIVVHRVEGSSVPGYAGTDQSRPFRVDRDMLTIEGDSNGIHFLRQLRRVR